MHLDGCLRMRKTTKIQQRNEEPYFCCYFTSSHLISKLFLSSETFGRPWLYHMQMYREGPFLRLGPDGAWAEWRLFSLLP